MLTVKDTAMILSITAGGGLVATQAPDVIWLLGAIASTAFILETWYAVRIYYRPFDPDLTYMSVIVGDLMYDLTLGAFLYVITGSLFMAALPFGWHVMCGLPMIIGQIIKNSNDVNDASQVKRSLRGSRDY